MSEHDKLALLRTMLEGESESDDTLLTYLSLAGRRIIEKAYPFRDNIETVPAKYAMKQIEIAAYLLNKRGAEGETYHAENGITRTYEAASVSDSMLAGVIPFCGGVGE